MIGTVVSIATPLLLAGTGGLVTELAGVLNIGLEGFILVGAFVGLLGASATGSVFVGVLFAAISGCGLAYLFAIFALRLKANIFVVGLSVNLLAIGVTALLSDLLYSTRGVIHPSAPISIAYYRIPVIESIPIVGDLVSGHSIFAPVTWMLVIATAIVVSRTRTGLTLRASGIDPGVVRVRGGDPLRYQLMATIFAGACGGIAGSVLSLELGAFVPNMSAGRGWIALVMIFLGRRRFWGVATAGIVFAAAEYGSNVLQGVTRLPGTLSLSFPYLITLTSMILFAVVARAQSRRREP